MSGHILTDPFDILKIIVCPSCRTKSLDTWSINNETSKKTKLKKTHLFFVCGYCFYTTEVFDEVLIKLFYDISIEDDKGEGGEEEYDGYY